MIITATTATAEIEPAIAAIGTVPALFSLKNGSAVKIRQRYVK